MSATAVLLLGLALIVAAGDWLALVRGDIILGYLCKPLVLFLLIVLALEIEPPNSDATPWFVMALALSIVGDVLLMFDRDQLYLGALSVFVGAHLAYIGGMLSLGVKPLRILGGALVAGAAVVAVGRKILKGVEERQPALVTPVQTYIGVALGMAVAAFAVGRPAGVFGAALFGSADALGGWNRFVRPHPLLPLATTITYHLGQIGLVLSLY